MALKIFGPNPTNGYATIYKIVLIVSLFIAFLIALTGLIYVTGNIAEGVRSYVRGEGLWAKAQKDAVQHLYNYSRTLEEREYDLFLKHIRVIEGDRQARLALSQPEPDLPRARQGFLDGNNHPDDVEHMIGFYLSFNDFYYMRQAILIWQRADDKVAELTALGQDLRAELHKPVRNFAKLDEFWGRLEVLSSQLNDLENSFSSVLGEGARWVRGLTLMVSVATLVVFTAIGLVVSLKIIRSVARDIAEKSAMEALILRQAREDSLTGLGNRKDFQEKLSEHLKLASRESKLLALLYVDLDKFKPVNDTHGHAVGDAALQAVSSILLKTTRQTDIVARLGGDEFAILLVHPHDRQVIAATAERILCELRAPLRIQDLDLHIGASIGISVYPEDGQDGDGLLQMADIALYHAKGAGRDACRFYSPDLKRA